MLISTKAVVLKVWISRPAASALSGNFSEMQILGPTPDALNQ